MVSAWLTSPDDESIEHFLHRLLEGEGVKGVGGFSLVCGKLRKRKQEIDPLAIISNRSGTPDDVPWIAEKRGEVYGLSNTSYDDPITWPKVEMGKEKLTATVEEVVEAGLGEEELVEKLFAVLDTDTLPPQGDQDFEEFTKQLRKSIFIPSIGDPQVLKKRVPKADKIAAATPNGAVNGENVDPEAVLEEDETPDATTNGMTGIYGTQRQTILLVDWEGNVTYRERSLWDDKGQPIERGKADMNFKFKVEGWNGESKGNEFHPHAVL